MRALALGRVIASAHPDFAEGDLVQGVFGVQEHALSDGEGVQKLASGTGEASLATYLGLLGMTGLTAYFGLLEVGRLQAGDTVLVSGAAGAVGSAVGQIAKIKGARAVGIAGGPDKCRLLTEELGFDAAIDYKAGDIHVRAARAHSATRRRLLRQRRRGDPQPGPDPARPRRPSRDLRGDLAVQQRRAA